MKHLLAHAAFWPGFLCGIVMGVPPAGAQEAAEQNAVHQFRLKHVADGFSYQSSHIKLARETPFAKEPDLGRWQIFRGALEMGKEPQDDIGIIWDRDAGRLHLDLNRNGDLTDDPPFENTTKEPQSRYNHIFTNIVLVSPAGPKHGLWTVDVSCYGYASEKPYGSLSVRSGWEAEIELRGRKRLLAVVDNADGVIDPDVDMLVLRNPGEPVREMDLCRGPGQQLFFDGQAYKLAFELLPGEDGGVVAATLSEVQVPMGDCQIQGENIAQLTLERNERPKAVLDHPRGTVAIPAGQYDKMKVFLDGGTALGILSSEVPAGLSIPTDKPGVIRAGGPLKNTVTVSSTGANRLQLDYKLLGAGGEQYRPPTSDPNLKPEFIVYKGDRKIASGSFEYG